MKLLLVIDGLWVGGTERSMAEMLRPMKDHGITPILVCLRSRPDEGIEREVLGKDLDIRFLNGSWIQNIFKLRGIIKEEKPALIHAALLKSNLTSRFANMGLAVPLLNSLVNTPYEPVRYEDPKIDKSRLRKVQRFDAWTSRMLATHFHAVSESAKASAVRTLGIDQDRITVIERGRSPLRLGLPTMERRMIGRQKFGLEHNAKVLVNVGRHDYQKGQKYLIEALPALVPAHPELKVIIAGRAGSESDNLNRMTESLRLTDIVKFIGHCNDVPELLSAADLFVFPSLFEGLPGAIIEAMALGLPVVAFDIPPNREVAEHGKNALLTEVASPTALSEAINCLLQDDSMRNRFGKCSREIFEERFTLDRSVQRMIELYKNVIDSYRQSA